MAEAGPETALDVSQLLQSLQKPMEFIKSHPLPSSPHYQAMVRGLQSGRPLAPSVPLPPAPPSEPTLPALPASNPNKISLLPNFQPSDSMMMPLLTLPAIMENPSRLLSGLALAPLWDGTEKGMIARNAVFSGMSPRSRDEIVHQNLLAFVMMRNLAASTVQQFTGADLRNGFFDWYNGATSGAKSSGVL